MDEMKCSHCHAPAHNGVCQPCNLPMEDCTCEPRPSDMNDMPMSATSALEPNRTCKNCSHDASKCINCGRDLEEHNDSDHEPKPKCEGCQNTEDDCDCDDE